MYFGCLNVCNIFNYAKYLPYLGQDGRWQNDYGISVITQIATFVAENVIIHGHFC